MCLIHFVIVGESIAASVLFADNVIPGHAAAVLQSIRVSRGIGRYILRTSCLSSAG